MLNTLGIKHLNPCKPGREPSPPSLSSEAEAAAPFPAGAQKATILPGSFSMGPPLCPPSARSPGKQPLLPPGQFSSCHTLLGPSSELDCHKSNVIWLKYKLAKMGEPQKYPGIY